MKCISNEAKSVAGKIRLLLQGYSYDQRLENVDNDFNVPHTPIVGLLHCRYNNNNIHIMM